MADDDRPDAWMEDIRKAYLLFREGLLSQALSILDDLIKQAELAGDADRIALCAKVATTYCGIEGKHDRAVKYLLSALKWKSDDLALATMVTSQCIQLGDVKQARLYLAQCKRLYTETPKQESVLHYGHLIRSLEKQLGAERELGQEATRSVNLAEPDRPADWKEALAKADGLFYEGRSSQALSILDDLMAKAELEENVDCITMCAQFAATYCSIEGDRDRATNYLLLASRARPDDLHLAISVTSYLVRLGDLTQARAHLAKCKLIYAQTAKEDGALSYDDHIRALEKSIAAGLKK